MEEQKTEYQLFYRYMKIAMPDGKETYECLLDGRASKLYLQKLDEYRFPEPVEVIACHEFDDIPERFLGATITVVGSIGDYVSN